MNQYINLYLESLKSARIKFGNELTNKWQYLDHTPTKKYLELILHSLINQTNETQLVSSYMDTIKEQEIRGFKPDVQKYKSLDKLAQDAYEFSKQLSGKDIRKQIRSGGQELIINVDYAEPLQSNEKYRFIVPLNHKAAATFGRKAEWCISMENNESYWLWYILLNTVFVICFPNSTNDKLYAIEINPLDIEFWEQENNMSNNKIKQKFLDDMEIKNDDLLDIRDDYLSKISENIQEHPSLQYLTKVVDMVYSLNYIDEDKDVLLQEMLSNFQDLDYEIENLSIMTIDHFLDLARSMYIDYTQKSQMDEFEKAVENLIYES